MKHFIHKFGRAFEWLFNLIIEELFQHYVVVAPYIWFVILVKYADYSRQDALRFTAHGHAQLAGNMMNCARVVHFIAILIPAILLVWNLYRFFTMTEKKYRPFSTTLRVTSLTILASAPMAAYVWMHHWFNPY